MSFINVKLNFTIKFYFKDSTEIPIRFALRRLEIEAGFSRICQEICLKDPTSIKKTNLEFLFLENYGTIVIYR